MKLKDIDYQTEFYWKGQRYKQVIRPKKQYVKNKAFKIVCCLSPTYGEPWVDMPSGREVKPVIKTVNAPKN